MTFITFEGPEGAGKTTQIARLASALRAQGHNVTETREPGGTLEAEALRHTLLDSERLWSPVSEALLMNAARDSHLRGKIIPALKSGCVVLCDRFFDSTEAYQGGEPGITPSFLKALRQAVVTKAPDATLILDLPPEIGLARAEARGAADRFEGKGLAFHQKVRDRFLSIARREPERCVVIDANQDPDTVEAAIQRAVLARLPGLLGGGDGPPHAP
ncbi:MAG: dTMP kinase [Pseudomonadota bacterium]